MGGYFAVVHDADNAGGRASREADEHYNITCTQAEAEAMLEASLNHVMELCSQLGMVVRQGAQNNGIGQEAASELCRIIELIEDALMEIRLHADHTIIDADPES